jgi:hypothetical protein
MGYTYEILCNQYPTYAYFTAYPYELLEDIINM